MSDRMPDAVIETEQSSPEIDPDILKQKITRTISYAVLSDKKVNFTKAMADKLLSLPTFPGERDLRDAHVDDLLAAAKGGTFLFNQTSIASCVCEWDGVERRLNGQHTAWMRTYMPDDWECPISFVKYSAPTEGDFRKLYSSIDRGAPRTRGHIVVARVFDTDTYAGITIPTIKLLQAGLSFWLDVGKSKLRPDQLATYMTGEHMDACLKVAKLIAAMGMTSKKHTHLRRGSVVAAMFETVRKSQSDSVVFWQTVADGLNVEDNEDARYKLREFLFKKKVGYNSANAKIDAETCNSEGMYRICVNAWNRWRAGESVKSLVPTKTRMAAK